jgi:LPXTG-motif cell wall-anchored protein
VYAGLDAAAQRLLDEKLGPLAPMVPKIAALAEPAGCMSVRALGTDQVTGRYMTVEGNKFVARIHVAHDLCAPELRACLLDEGERQGVAGATGPARTLQAIIQANAAGDPCASQGDLSRAGSLEGGQVTLPGIIGYLQTDTPAAAACTAVAGATQTHDPGVASSVAGASGTLPNTGSGPLPLAIMGFVLIALGWLALCFASLESAATRHPRVTS